MDKTDKLYKTFFGKTIDLSQIIAISDAQLYYADNYNIKVGFDIDVKLRDEPIVFKRDLRGEKSYDELIIKDGYEAVFEWRNGNSYFQISLLFEDGLKLEPLDALKQPKEKCIAVKNLQKEVDGLINIWALYNLKIDALNENN